MRKENKDEYVLAYESHSDKSHVRVYKPILTEDEREKRMGQIKEAAQDFLAAYYKQQARAERAKNAN